MTLIDKAGKVQAFTGEADPLRAPRSMVVRPMSPWEKRRATRTVAHHAHDAAEAALFLAMLDLTARDGLAS